MEIISFEDGTIIEQGRGSFDDYCVYVTRSGERKFAPRDVIYFSFFIEKARKYSAKKIYDDYVKIYERTTARIDQTVFDMIKEMGLSYDEEDRLDFCVWYSVIYLGMVAEELKARAVLKKRIKRLGMHQILFEGMSAEKAAKFSIGKKVPQLEPLCRERGF